MAAPIRLPPEALPHVRSWSGTRVTEHRITDGKTIRQWVKLEAVMEREDGTLWAREGLAFEWEWPKIDWADRRTVGLWVIRFLYREDAHPRLRQMIHEAGLD